LHCIVPACIMTGVVGLLASYHSAILRIVNGSSGRHANGLAQTAREQPGRLPTRVVRQLVRLVAAHHVVRHLGTVVLQRLFDEVSFHMQGGLVEGDISSSMGNVNGIEVSGHDRAISTFLQSCDTINVGMASSNKSFYSGACKVYTAARASGTSAGNVCSSEGGKVYSSEGGIGTTTGKVYTNEGGKSYSHECKACGSEGGMRGVREVQPLPSAMGRVVVLRALFEDGIFLRGGGEAPADDEAPAARPRPREVPARGEVPTGGDGEVPADGGALADAEVPADGGMDMLVAVNRWELQRGLLARFSRRFSALIRSLQCEVAITDEDVGIGALFTCAESSGARADRGRTSRGFGCRHSRAPRLP